MQKEVIILKETKTSIYTKTVYGQPTLGSLGSYWLQKEEYVRMDAEWKHRRPEKWRRLKFNDQFMQYMEKEFGELHCEFCGKQNLKIFK